MTRASDLDMGPILKRSRARLAHLRDDLFLRLRSAMDRPLRFADDEAMDLPIACWRDAGDAFNCMHVLSYRLPSDAEPRCPMLPRIHANFWCVPNRSEIAALAGWSVQARPRWSSQITVLPWELGDFAGWIAALIRVADGLEPLPIPAPPHPCYFGSAAEPVSRYIWTVAAWETAQRYDRQPMLWGLGDPPAMRARL